MEDLSVDAMQFDNILPTVEFFFFKIGVNPLKS